MRPTDEQFRAAWPRVVRILAAWSGSLDDAEEHAAEAMARALDRDDVEDLAAWCVRVAKRAWIDEHRRRAVLSRVAPDLAGDPVEAAMADDLPPGLATGLPDGLDDRLALLFVACDPALARGAQLVLALRVVCGLDVPAIATHLGIKDTAAAARLTRAKRALAEAQEEFRVPGESERATRLPVVLECVAGMFTVAHRTDLAPEDALSDTGTQALSIADALVALHPADTEVRGLRAVVRLGLARRPGRVDDEGVALTLDEVDRSLWDRRLLREGLRDATHAAQGDGRFALEAAVAGLHCSARSCAETDWAQVVSLYDALASVWPSPAVEVARLVAGSRLALRDGDAARLGEIERELGDVAEHGPAYAARDAGFALADLRWRTGRRGEAAEGYRALLGDVSSLPVRRFCERRIAQAPRMEPPSRP